ncbi:MAG: hypothetical protein IKI97_04660 [Clostridia bacterium]|nr:hypothetical protein [Clostridia bacterium]
MKKKYKYKSKRKNIVRNEKDGKSKTSLSVKKRMFLLLGWSAVAVGLYIALSKRFFVYSLWFFAILLMLAFIWYFITGIRVSRCVHEGRGDSQECKKLIDTGKRLLIFMIPIVFIIIYDFISSTIKMFK